MAMTLKPQNKLRRYALAFAVILGLQAIWILAAESFRQPLPYFPTGQAELNAVAAHSDTALTAARIGWIRGDLWADYAATSDVGIINDTNNLHANSKGTHAQMRQITEHAASFAPYDSRIWLLLAASNAQSGWKDDKTAAQLKMSFYTSPNDIRLIPLRLRIATQSDAVVDDEMQYLIEHEIRTIVLNKPNLKLTIAFAHRAASPGGRQLIEKTLDGIDPKYSAELRATKP